MKKISILLSILAVCFISSNSLAQIEQAQCSGTYYLIDANYNPATDTYTAVIEVVTQHPTDTYGYLPPVVTPLPSTNNFYSVIVNGVWYNTPPISANYYTIVVHVVKYTNGAFVKTNAGSSLASFFDIGGTYYMTANNSIRVTM